MKQKKIPMRTCVITKEKCPKIELIRIVKTNEDKVIVDLTGKVNGRGAYLKRDLETINKAEKTKQLNYHLGIDVPKEIYEELRKSI